MVQTFSEILHQSTSRKFRLVIHTCLRCVDEKWRESPFNLVLNTLCVTLALTALFVCLSANASNDSNITRAVEETTVPPTENPEEKEPGLPAKGAAEEEKHSSLTIFFVLLIVGE